MKDKTVNIFRENTGKVEVFQITATNGADLRTRFATIRRIDQTQPLEIPPETNRLATGGIFEKVGHKDGIEARHRINIRGPLIHISNGSARDVTDEMDEFGTVGEFDIVKVDDRNGRGRDIPKTEPSKAQPPQGLYRFSREERTKTMEEIITAEGNVGDK
jgi:hypothetical protein